MLSLSKNSFEHESLDIYLIYVKGLIFFSFVKRVKQVNGHFETVEKKRGNRFEHLFVSAKRSEDYRFR